jgi:uncharacterized protein (AIM24 family)
MNVFAGAMVAMSPSVTLKGSYKFSLKKMFTGGEMSVSTFTGPGESLRIMVIKFTFCQN